MNTLNSWILILSLAGGVAYLTVTAYRIAKAKEENR